MKNRIILGVLMAAAITATPATGLAGNVLSFNDNAIVAEAANTPASVTIYGNGIEYRQSNNPVLKNGSYALYYRNNRIEVTQTVKAGRSTQVRTRKYRSVGGVKLSMQGDGNLVTYNQSGRPVWHTNTWMYNLSDPKVRFTYQLTSTGTLQIKRTFLTGQFAGKYDIIWQM